MFKALGVSDLLGSKTQNYGEAGTVGFRTAQLFHWEERPIFTLTTAELMEYDPKITIALAIRNGMLKQGDVKVTGHPVVAKFVREQWDKLWGDHGSQIMRTKIYGHSGFEVLYKTESEQTVVSGLRDFHPRDCRPLTADGKIVGISVRNNRAKNDGGLSSAANKEAIWAPKALWLTFKARHNQKFGESLLEHCYAPWWEKWMRGGAVKMRQLRMQKDAWIGDIIKYPSNKVLQGPNGERISYRDMARELVELRASGGVMGIPSDTDIAGKPLFDYLPPQHIDGATMMFDYIKQLDDEIVEGCEVAKEVVVAAETGSGFSGRSIPFIGTLSVLQEEFDGYVREINRMVIGPLVRLNFGKDAEYKLAAVSLIETVGKLMGGDEGASGGSHSGPSQTMGGVPGGFNNANIPNSGNSSSGYTSAESFSDGVDSRARVRISNRNVRDRLSPRLTPQFGATVGGVYYRGGVWVSGEAIQFASDDELDFLDGIVETEFVEEKPPAVVGEAHSFSCVMAFPPEGIAESFRMLHGLLDPAEVVELETDPHVTVLYGLETNQAFDVERLLFGQGPTAMRVGRFTAFTKDGDVFTKDDTDVVVAEIESEGLRALNSLIATLPSQNSYPDYRPHMTVAYVRPGSGQAMADLLNAEAGEIGSFVSDAVVFSNQQGERTTIPLLGPVQFADGKWITIGGKAKDGKKHAGGFAVEIDGEGRILKGGPAGLQGKKLSEVGAYFDSTRAERKRSFDDVSDFFAAAKSEVEKANAAVAAKAKATGGKTKPAAVPTEADAPGVSKSYKKIVAYQADKWGMSPDTYEQMSSELFSAMESNELAKEKARVYLRERTGLRVPRISQLERQGKDYSHVKGLDVVAREVASMYGDIGWNEDDGDLDEKAWELLKQGQVRVSKVSVEFHDAVDDYLEGELRRSAESYNPDLPDVDSSQFSGV